MRQKGDAGFLGKALLAGSIAVAFIPVIGSGISHLIDRSRHRVEANAEKTALADWYRNQVAAQLGMNPKSVTMQDFELAARHNPMLASAIEKVEAQRKSDNRASMLAAGAGTAASVMLPGVGGGVTKIAAEMSASAAGYGVAKLMDKDKLFAQDAVDMINEKRASGQEILAEDVFLLRIAQHEGMQEELAKANGKAFHKLTEAQQAAVMKSMPDFYATAQREAYALNQGMISEQDLMVSSPISGAGWSQSRAERNHLKGSFRDRVSAERVQNAALQARVL